MGNKHQSPWRSDFICHHLNFSSSDEQILQEVKKYIGTRYRWGGSTKQGVDCSGFVRLIYKKIFGVDLPHKVSYQCSLPIFNRVSLEKLRTGDLIFFSSTEKKRKINHVGIYLADGNFAHALRKKGVNISNIDEQHWKSRLISAKRIICRKPK